MRKRTLASLTGIFGVFSILVSVPSIADPLQLRPGFQQILDHPGATRISIGNPNIIEARPLRMGAGVIVVG